MESITPGWDRHHWDGCLDARRSDPSAARREAIPDPALDARFARIRKRITDERRARIMAKLEALARKSVQEMRQGEML